MPTVQQQRDKLVNLLKELFQLDQPDLDFGFYKIMHAKAKQVTAFLENDLLKIVEEKFGENNAARVAQLQKAYEDAVAQAKSFGAADLEQTEPVRRAKAAMQAAKDTSRAEGEVYDHLYRFFERYYDAGDFMSRRYLSRETSSKAAAYAVPYDGSEVCMHWANKDQYYIKTAEYFTDFTFDPTQAMEVKQADGLFQAPEQSRRVHFRIVAATEGEHGNVKVSETAKRHFLLHKEAPIVIENGELTVRFEYRPDPEKTGQEKTWQAKRNEEAVARILKALTELDNAQAKEYLAILKVPSPTERQADRPLLAKYVAQYTARNTMDYFIHKDLGGFLRRELDFYIKNEVMRLDDIESADAPKVDQYLEQIKVLRQIAGKMIDFLAQLEDFQKKLWLKKKFVTECHYCITLDRILGIRDGDNRQRLIEQVLGNAAQREEWVRLLRIDAHTRSLTSPAYTIPLTEEFLHANTGLVVDTRHFDSGFRDQLLQEADWSDASVGLTLLHSENFQALCLLWHSLSGRVNCVYIDPPYNSKTTKILYKNSYEHSSWVSLMDGRLEVSRRLVQDDGSHVVAIDENEQERLGMLLAQHFPAAERVCVSVIHNKKGIQGDYFSYNHEYAYFCIPPSLPATNGTPIPETEWEYDNLRKWGRESERSTAKNCFYPILVKGGEIVGFGDVCHDDEHPGVANLPSPSGDVAVYPVDSQGIERKWRYARGSVMAIKHLLRVHVTNTGEIQIHKAKAERHIKTVWDDPKYIAGDYGTRWLTDLGLKVSDDLYPKSIHTVKDAIHAVSPSDGIVLDYFGGSGTTAHAVMELNREDAGSRRCVLIEMADYFDTVIVPRVKKVAFSREWADGMPCSQQEPTSCAFKYLCLESYEDCLNNVELKDNSDRDTSLAQNLGLREDYMLHYMLDVETRGSASLLNIDRFADPTAYKLKIKRPGSDEYEWKNVDLLETFNYLIGLRVEHIAAPQVFTAKFDREKDPDLPDGQLGRLVLKGRLKQDPDGKWWFRKVEGWVPKNWQTPNDGQREKVLIVWRKLTDDIEQDNLVLDEWFRKYQINPRESYDYDTIYVNGSNNLPNLKLESENWRVRLIEEDFHRLMWDIEEM